MADFKTIETLYIQNMFKGEQKSQVDTYKELDDLNLVSDRGEDLYHLAARFFDYEAIDYLFSQNIRAKSDDYEGSAFHSFLKSPYFNTKSNVSTKEEDIYKTTQSLINAKINPKKKNSDSKSPIYEAGSLCIYPILDAFCDQGIKLDVIGEEQKNILHEITSCISHKKSDKDFIQNAIKSIKILLEKGGLDKEDRDIFDTTAITYAQRSGMEEIIRLFLDEGVKVKTAGLDLAKAVIFKNVDAVKALVEEGNCLNEMSDDYKKTALMMACEYPYLEIVKILIEAGANVNEKNPGENTALFYLLKSGLNNLNAGVQGGQKVKTILDIEIALIEGGLDVDDTIDVYLNTPLNFIAQSEFLADLNYSLMEELINVNCNLNKPNRFGLTPLMSFANIGDENRYGIAELLIDSGADVNLADSSGNTALIYASMNTNHASGARVAKLIIEANKASITHINNNKESALDVAVKSNNEKLVKLLLDNL